MYFKCKECKGEMKWEILGVRDDLDATYVVYTCEECGREVEYTFERFI